MAPKFLRNLAGRRIGSWLLVACVAIAPGLVALTACGSESTSGQESATKQSSSADLAYAAAQVEKYRQTPEFVVPGPSFDATKAKGKRMLLIPSSSTIPFVALQAERMKEIATSLGIKATIWPSPGDSASRIAGINNAIQTKVDLLVLVGGPNPLTLQPQLAQAKAAGVPVLLASYMADGEALPPNVTVQVTVPSPKMRRVLADWVIHDSKGKANVLWVTSSDSIPARPITAAAVDEFKVRCGESCKVKVLDVPIADWATKLQGAVQSAITADPTINYVGMAYDGMAQFVVPAITQVGAKSRVKAVGGDGTPFALKFIRDKNIVAANVALGPLRVAYANMDQALRYLLGLDPLRQGNPQEPRLFDSTNIADTGTPPTDTKGFGDDYVSGYERIWGLRK